MAERCEIEWVDNSDPDVGYRDAGYACTVHSVFLGSDTEHLEDDVESHIQHYREKGWDEGLVVEEPDISF